MMKKIFVIFLLILFCFLPAFAEGTLTGTLSLDEALELVSTNNLDIFISSKNVDKSKKDIKIVNALKNPKFETFFYLGNTSIGNPQQGGITLPIEVMKRKPRKEKAISNFGSANIVLQQDIFKIKMTVRSRYIEYAGYKSILKDLLIQQKLLEKTLAVSKNKLNKTDAAEIEYLQAKIIYNQIITQIKGAENEEKLAQILFNKSLNLIEDSLFDIIDDGLEEDSDYEKFATPKPDTNPLSLEDAEKIAFEKRLDIQLAKSDIDTAQKELKIAESKKIPDISVSSGYMYLSDFQNNDFGISDGGVLQGAFVGGSIDLPILYRYNPEIQKAKINIEQKKLVLKSVQNKARQDVRKAYLDFVNSRDILNYYHTGVLEDSDKVIKYSHKAYATNEMSLTTLIVSQQTHLNLLRSYMLALIDYYDDWLNLLSEMNVENIDFTKTPCLP
ncbi:MAG: TolC family protein [Candidatus Gastranaerophilales bacterium]|nr:TolC family protein [Candidatus Gastranaerophilales bacterium]